MVCATPQYRFTVVAILLVLAPLAALHAQNCTINSSFNATSIAGGSYVGFNAVVSVHGVGNHLVSVNCTASSISFSVDGVPQTIPAPGAAQCFGLP